MGALTDRNKVIRHIVDRLRRDAQGDPSASAIREMAEIDLLCASLMGDPSKLDQYLRALALRAQYSQRLRITPAAYRPSTSLPEGDDPYVKAHLKAIGELDDDAR